MWYCHEGDRRGRNYSRRLEQWLDVQAHHGPGHPAYEAALRKARLAGEIMAGLCDNCPYAGREGGKPCE